MTTGIRNLTTICLAALLAFGLAACGGGSKPDPTPPAPTALEIAEANLMKADEALAATPDYAPDATKLPLEQAVLAAAQAVLDALTDADASASAVAAARARVTAAQALVDATQARIQAAIDEEERRKAEEARLAALQKAIDDARAALTSAQATLAALPATATDQERLTAQQMVVTAATGVVDALLAADSTATLVDPARAALRMAQAAVDATQKAIDDAAEQARLDEEERQRVAAEQKKIDDAQMALTNAQSAVAGLPDYTPDTVRIELEKAVHTAAQNLVTVLEAAGIWVDPIDIDTAKTTVTTAMATVDATQKRIDDEAERQRQIADAQEKIDNAREALTDAKSAVQQLPDYTPDTVLIEAQKAVKQAADALVAALVAADSSASVVDAARLDVSSAQDAIDATQKRIDDEAARLAEQERQQKVAMEEAEAIADARQALMDAKEAQDGLADDAYLAARQAARQAVLDAAEDVVTALEAAEYHEVTLADIDAARDARDNAQSALQATIDGGKYDDEQLMDARSALATATAAGTVTEAIKAEVLRTLALSGNADETATKQEMLYQAQAALAALPADATAATTLAEQQKVLAAAKAWKMELEEADAAHSMVMMAQGEVDAAQSAVDTTVAMMERGTQIATNVKEANNLAEVVRGASGARSGSETATGFDRTQSGDTDGYGVNITRLGPLSSLTFTLVDGADDNDADASELTALKSKYVTEYKDGKAVETDVPSPQSISGWHGRQFWSRDAGTKATDVADDMETGRVVVYTNIDEGGNVAISAAGANVSGISSVDSSTGVLTIGGGNLDQANKSGVFGTFFPSASNTNLDYKYDTDANKTGQQGYKGTLYGVSGEYFCGTGAGSACQAVVNSDGTLSVTGDGITFRATAASDTARLALMLRNAVVDTDFLHFGYWLKTTDGATAADPSTYGLQTFAEGSDPYGTVRSVEGSASYAGKAAGIYVREESPGGQRGGNVVDATTGTFTASAELTATFGGDASTKTDDKFRISGTVKDFMNDAGRDLGWTVMLNRADTNGRGTDGTLGGGTEPNGTFSGNTTGDGTAQSGSWNGQFYGPSTTVLPSGVAGEFDANFNDGYVAGAFGAERN